MSIGAIHTIRREMISFACALCVLFMGKAIRNMRIKQYILPWQ